MTITNINSKIDPSDIVINTTRYIRASQVEIQFKHGDITVRTSMKCIRTLQAELDTQRKLLTYLGFDDEQIKELSYE